MSAKFDQLRRLHVHGIGTFATMSSITCSEVMPWLVACGPSQMRWLKHVLRELLHVFGIHLCATVHQNGPDLDEPSPADRRARRCAEVDVLLDHLRRRAELPVGFRVVRPRGADETPDVLPELLVEKHFARDHAAKLDDAVLRHQLVEAHLLEVEIHELLLLFRRQVTDVHHDRETIGRRFRQRERALPELHRIHRRDGKAERRQVVGRIANRDLAILQAFEKRALRFQRDAVDFVEQDDFRGRERAELRRERPRGGVDHLKPDDLGGLQVGAPLKPRKLRVADRGDDHAEERLADTRHPSQQQVAGVHLSLLVLVVRRRNLRHQHDIGERLLPFVSDQGLAGLGDDGVVKVDGFFQLRMHDIGRPIRARATRLSDSG